MTNNIQKSFKKKSELRAMANGGLARREVNPDVLGTGGAARAGHQIRAHNRNTAAEIDALFAPAASPAPQPASPAKKPKEKSALRSFFGLADGGQVQVFKNTVGGVPTYTDAKAATAGAKPYTPGQGGGTFSVISTPTRTPSPSPVPTQPAPLTGAAPSPSPVPTQPAPLTGAAPSPLSTAAPPPTQSSGFTPQEMEAFDGMRQTAAANAAQMRDIGVQAGEAAAAAARPTSPLQFNSLDAPSFELESDGELEFADGGKVKGKGGPTDDKVGPVMLSDGEYVLPADTVDIVGRDKLDALRLATHDFVDDDNKPKVSGLRKMANGGPLYADPEGVGSRRLLNMGLEQPPQPAAGSSGGGGRGIVPYQPTATGSPGGGGRGLVPYQPPTGPSTAMVRPAPQKIHIADPAGKLVYPRGLGGGNLLRLLGRASLVGNALAALPAVNASAGEWARGIPGVLRGESAPQPNTRVRFLDENGQPIGSATPSPQGATPVEDVLGSSAMASASDPNSGGGIDGSYSGAMENRSGLPNNDPRINGSTSALYNARGDDDVVGSFQGKPMTKREADARAAGLQTASFMPPEREPSQADQMRSLLREFGGGGGGSYGGGTSASSRRAMADINKRYDDMLRDGSGRNRVRGLDWSQRHGLDLERARASELGEFARNQSVLRGQDMQADASAANNRTAAMQAVAGMMERQQAAGLKAAQDAQAQTEARMKDNAEVFESIADTFAAGDEEKKSQYRELLATLPPELHATAQDLAPEDKRAFYTNIVRQQLGRNEGLVLGRDAGATAQNAVVGGLVGRMMRSKNGGWGKAIDKVLGKIPRVGPVISALRPAENLARFSTVIGAGGGAYATPEVENYTRWDPHARDPETGAALPARKDIREAATYGVFDTYLNPFDDSVQTVSGRRTSKPTPDEEEAARRFRSALRN